MKKTLVLALLLIGIFAAVTAFFFGGLGKDPRVLPSVKVGKPLPTFTLPNLDDRHTYSNADLPDAPYLLNIWGSWCPACHIEHPYLMKLNQQIAIIGLNWPAGNATETTDGAQFLKQLGNPYQMIIKDEEGGLITDLGVYGAPETFLISADGTILHRYAGPLDANIWRTQFLPLLGDNQ